MDNLENFTKYDTIQTFIIIVLVIIIVSLITLFISTYPPKKIIEIIHKYPKYDLTKYYFYYQKSAAYRLLFISHLTFAKIVKISGTTATFIVVYCAIDNNDFLLLFSLTAAICDVISLTIPFEIYSKMYVQAARKLEYILYSEEDFEDNDLLKKLSKAYQEAEKIIEEIFE